MIHVCDLAQNRVEAGEGSRARHVRASVRIAEHRFINVKISASVRIVDAFVVMAASSAVDLSVS